MSCNIHTFISTLPWSSLLIFAVFGVFILLPNKMVLNSLEAKNSFMLLVQSFLLELSLLPMFSTSTELDATTTIHSDFQLSLHSTYSGVLTSFANWEIQHSSLQMLTKVRSLMRWSKKRPKRWRNCQSLKDHSIKSVWSRSKRWTLFWAQLPAYSPNFFW